MRIIALFVLLLPTLANAQTSGGVGARAQGMAGAFVAVADDASAIYWNPAGLAWPTGATFDAQFYAGSGGESRKTSFLALGTPPLGLSYYRIHQRPAAAGFPTVSVSESRKNEGSGVVHVRTLSTTNFGITVLQTIVDGLVIGSTVRLVTGAIEGFEGRTTFDVDAGALVSAGDIRLGLSARNIRQPAFQGEKGPIPMQRHLRIGAAFAPRSPAAGIHGPFSLAFDADLTTTTTAFADEREAAVGGEYWLLGGRFGTRAGVRWSTLKRGNQAISGGLTARLPRSLFIEGHVTKLMSRESELQTSTGVRPSVSWGAGMRLTF